VRYIVDGDTLVVMQAAREEKVRIDRIDALEAGARALCNRERRLATEATSALGRLAPVGSVVEVVGGRRDRYGRWLADVLAGGTDVGRELVRLGLAQWWNGRWPKPEWCGPSIS